MRLYNLVQRQSADVYQLVIELRWIRPSGKWEKTATFHVVSLFYIEYRRNMKFEGIDSMAAIYGRENYSLFIGDKELKGFEPYVHVEEPFRDWKIPVDCEVLLNNGIRVVGKGIYDTATETIVLKISE